MRKRIAVLPGDGIGPEVMAQALRVLSTIASKFHHQFEISEALVGGAAFDKYGCHFPDETADICRESDAILYGSVGGPIAEQHLEKWKGCEANALLALRKLFQLNVNFRPIQIFPQLVDACPIRKEIIERGVDFIVLRELVGDIYFGEKRLFERQGRRVATDVAEYTEDQIAAIGHVAFQAARQRRRKVTSVDKANVLQTSKLWRVVMREVSKEYQDVTLEDMLVDNCAMQIIQNPAQFDVIVTSNMFGDILSDAAAVLPGSLGLMASASMNENHFGMFEPPGGSAPDIAGQGIANPIGQILSAALMLRFAFGLNDEAAAIESAVQGVLADGVRTRDISKPAERVSSTAEMGAAICAKITSGKV